MAGIGSRDSAARWLGRELLGPLDDALGLARRYRDLEAFRNYVSERLTLVLPACLMLAIAAAALGLTPIMLLVGTQAGAALAGLLLAPVVLAGSLFVLGLVFFSWIEERSLARSLGHRSGRAPGRVARWLKRKLRLDLGRAPRVPWLLAALFVGLPFVFLVRAAPAIGVTLAGLLVALPFVYARLDR